MNATEHLLSCLAEECAEVSQLCSKAMRFGLDDRNVLDPNGPNNRQRLTDELNDLLAVISMLESYGNLYPGWFSLPKQQAKRIKVKEFMDYAVTTGALELPKP